MRIAFILSIAVTFPAVAAAQFSGGLISGSLGANNAKTEKPINPLVTKGKFAERVQKAGALQVEIRDAFIGKLTERETDGPIKKTVQDREYLQFKVRITNPSNQKQQAAYYSWSYHANFPISLQDSDGNQVKIWQPQMLREKGSLSYIDGGVRVAGWIKPGSSVIDVVAFESPGKIAGNMKLILPVRNFNMKGRDLAFNIPDSWFNAPLPTKKK